MLIALLLTLLPAGPVASPDEPVDTAAVRLIRAEATERSQVMAYAFMLTDVLGPRLTGTPAYRAAGDWAAEILMEMGLSEVHREPIDWGRGWAAQHASLHLVEPQPMPLIAAPVPWSGGSDGRVEGEPILVPLPDWETPAAYRAFFDAWRGRLNGRILMANAEIPGELPPMNELIPRRLSEEALADRIRRQEEAARTAVDGESEEETYDPDLFSSPAFFAWQDSLHRFLSNEGVAAILYASAGRGGVVDLNGPMRRQGVWLRHPQHVLPPPSFVVASEHYIRILRLLDADVPVRLSVVLETQLFEEPRNAFNLVAELPGTDKRDELVMLGAHFDSWHLGTGASDNAAGAAVVMEAMRILAALDRPMSRTVRMALWGGHEGEGLGSRTYVNQHFDAGYPTTWLEEDVQGRRHEPHPAYEKLSAYFNLDYLAGRIRGLFLQENEAVRPIFEAWLAPFATDGAAHVTEIMGGGSDHMAFEDVGLPGYPFLQDGPPHGIPTHHANMDVLDYVDEADLKQSAMILASVIYHAATRDELLPRKPRLPTD